MPWRLNSGSFYRTAFEPSRFVILFSDKEIAKTNFRQFLNFILFLLDHFRLQDHPRVFLLFWLLHLDKFVWKLWLFFYLRTCSVQAFVSLLFLLSELLSKCTVKSVGRKYVSALNIKVLWKLFPLLFFAGQIEGDGKVQTLVDCFLRSLLKLLRQLSRFCKAWRQVLIVLNHPVVVIVVCLYGIITLHICSFIVAWNLSHQI